MFTYKVTCDKCGTDITYTDNVDDYRLVLMVERISSNPNINVLTSMNNYPPIARNMHFCGIKCLKTYSF
jgi:hypothetical protein